MAFPENLDQFFDTDDFAVQAIINTSPTPRTINVIFESPTEGVQMYETAVESDAPFLKCKTSDLSGVTRSNTVTVNAVVYKIGKIAQDGNGTSKIYLKT